MTILEFPQRIETQSTELTVSIRSNPHAHRLSAFLRARAAADKSLIVSRPQSTATDERRDDVDLRGRFTDEHAVAPRDDSIDAPVAHDGGHGIDGVVVRQQSADADHHSRRVQFTARLSRNVRERRYRGSHVSVAGVPCVVNHAGLHEAFDIGRQVPYRAANERTALPLRRQARSVATERPSCLATACSVSACEMVIAHGCPRGLLMFEFVVPACSTIATIGRAQAASRLRPFGQGAARAKP
jgi:hypothetical protein